MVPNTFVSPKSSRHHLSYNHLSKHQGSRLGLSSVCLPFDLVFPPLHHYLGSVIDQHYLIICDLICILEYFVIRSSPEN